MIYRHVCKSTYPRDIQGLVSLSDYINDTLYILSNIEKILKALDIEDYHYNNGAYISPHSLHEYYVKSYRDYRKFRQAPDDLEDVRDDLDYFITPLIAISEEDWDYFIKPYKSKDITKIEI